MVAAPHQGGGELGSSGDAHQDDGDDGQHDVDGLPQQDAGVGAFQLNCLLLVLLMELQLGHPSLTRLEGFLKQMVQNVSMGFFIVLQILISEIFLTAETQQGLQYGVLKDKQHNTFKQKSFSKLFSVVETILAKTWI